MPTLKFTPPKIESVQSGKVTARKARPGELNKRGKQKKFVGVFYEDTEKKEYKDAIRIQAIPQLRGFRPIAGCVRTYFVFYFQRPLSHYRNNDRSRPLKADMPMYCTKTPDITDNACKGIADALTGLAWVDDKLIVSHRAEKFWTYEPDHIILEFEEIEWQNSDEK